METTINNKGNPFDETNTLILIQIKNKNKSLSFTIDNFNNSLLHIKQASILIGSNFKFDLHWMRRELNYIPTCPIWDLQLAEFILSNQTWKYPDLDTIGIKYNLGEKIHTIKENYWNKGINTDQIPINELIEYGIQDVDLSYAVFLEQVKRFSTVDQDLFPLFRLQCNDLLVLQEMEWNGLIYDENNSLQKANEIDIEIKNIENKLNSILDFPNINFNSNDDLSLILYGGVKKSKNKVPTGFYKTGLKAGQVKYSFLDTTIIFPRLVTPLKGSELLKEGFYSTDEPTLRALSPNSKAKTIITLLLERAHFTKLNSTYLKGLPKLREKMNWPPNKLYSTLNQCVAITSRLTSTKPNQQNLAPLAKQFCISRY